MYVVGSMYEACGNLFYNSSPLIDPEGRIVGKYWKTHLFDAPNRPDIKGGIRESDKVCAGGELPVFPTAHCNLGVSVCSDLRFPAVYRELALNGAEMIVCASAFLTTTGSSSCAPARPRTSAGWSPPASTASSRRAASPSSAAR